MPAGDMAPGPQRNHVPPRLAPLAEALRARVASGSDASLAELRAWVLAEHGVRVSQPVMCVAVPWPRTRGKVVVQGRATHG